MWGVREQKTVEYRCSTLNIRFLWRIPFWFCVHLAQRNEVSEVHTTATCFGVNNSGVIREAHEFTYRISEANADFSTIHSFTFTKICTACNQQLVAYRENPTKCGGLTIYTLQSDMIASVLLQLLIPLLHETFNLFAVYNWSFFFSHFRVSIVAKRTREFKGRRKRKTNMWRKGEGGGGGKKKKIYLCTANNKSSRNMC
jgi:hypothetical protein